MPTLRNCKGQVGIGMGELFLIIILLIALGGLVYLLFKKDSSPQIYKAGSNPRVVDVSPHPTMFGCVDVKVQEWKDAIDTNKTVD